MGRESKVSDAVNTYEEAVFSHVSQNRFYHKGISSCIQPSFYKKFDNFVVTGEQRFLGNFTEDPQCRQDVQKVNKIGPVFCALEVPI